MKYIGIIILTLATLHSFNGYCQSRKENEIKTITLPENSFTKIASLPSHINEASGLAITSEKNIWTHNDGGVPVLFCLDSTGQLIKTLHLNHRNNGWEDLATDENGNLYIGSFGNNKNDRRDLKIFRIPNPDSITTPVFTAEIISFSYEDQFEFPPRPNKRNFDCDAFIILNGSIYLFTKNRTLPFTGFTRIYKLPTTPGVYKAALIDSLYLGQGAMMDYWVTGADYSSDNKTLVLLGHSSVWLIKDMDGERFSTGDIFHMSLNHYSHKAGIAFKSKNLLYIVDEKEFGLIGGDLYQLNLEKILNNLK
ncbi:MAG: hypothetical protein KF687_13690 [Cyclobacteriaceae bacterium]|nr:hypothetical protein [Cyclobacteriaceae bacterium]